jgi:hypothetical protein
MNNVATRTMIMDRVVTVRPATAEDMEAVWDMWKEIMDQKAYYPYDESLGHTREYILEEWVNLRNPIHVATMRILAQNGGTNNMIPVEIVVGAFILRDK